MQCTLVCGGPDVEQKYSIKPQGRGLQHDADRAGGSSLFANDFSEIGGRYTKNDRGSLFLVPSVNDDVFLIVNEGSRNAENQLLHRFGTLF